jgi:putative membrane protein
MRNALRVLRRDLGRFARTPLVWAILGGIIVIPSLYAWVNIIAFWNPYSNASTQKVKVAIVNLDKGGSSKLTGRLNVGDQIVAQLKDNHQLGWQFVGEQEAMTAVKSGSNYAAIVIPPTFSRDLLTVATPDFVRPKLRYYVNEKANPIAPKITAVGASTLQTQVNATFVSTVAEKVAEQARTTGKAAGKRIIATRDSTVTALDTAMGRVTTARAGLDDVQSSLASGRTALGDAKGALTDAQSSIAAVQTSVREVQALVAQAQRALVRSTDSVTKAFVTGTTELADISGKLDTRVTAVTDAVQHANVVLGATIDDLQTVVDANTKALGRLEDLLATAPPGPTQEALQAAVAQMKARSAADEQLLQKLKTLNTDVADVTRGIGRAADKIDAAVRSSERSASRIRRALTTTIPDVDRAMSEMSASASAFSSSLDAQSALVAQAVSLVTSLEGQLDDTDAALGALDGNLGDVQSDLFSLRTDVAALTSAEIWRQLRGLTGLKPSQIAKFMSSPVQVKERDLFPIDTYGSSMAPLFTNLALWIGAFMLVVLIKLEADTEGVKRLTVRQAYLGRWMLLAVLNLLQALLVSIGVIVIGVQMANAPVFVLTAVVTGLVYLSVIYALTMAFGYIGKGIAILLVIMQIPGTSGIYPIQMMPDFFQAIFPYLPFSYGIDAMRETIGGFYEADYLRYMAVLLLFAALSFLVGILLRQRLGNLARLLNRELGATGLFVSEDVRILGSRRRLTQITQALTDRERFREKTAERARWFDRHRMQILQLSIVAGVAVTVVLLAVALLFPAEKSTVLGLWGGLCLLLIGFLVVLEYLRQNVGFAEELGDTPDAQLKTDLVHEEQATHSSTALDDLAVQGERA